MEKWEPARDFMQTMGGMRHLRWNEMLRDVSDREFGFLMMIRRYQRMHPQVPGIYVSELAQKMHVTKSGASKMLRNLEQRGLIVREVDESDRRSTFVSLTQNGQTVCQQQHARWCALMERVAGQVGHERFRAALAGMREITEVIEREMNAGAETETTEEETRCGLF